MNALAMAMRTHMHGMQKEKTKHNSYNKKENKLKSQLLFKQSDVRIYQKHTKPALHAAPPIPEDVNNKHKEIYSKSKQKIN